MILGADDKKFRCLKKKRHAKYWIFLLNFLDLFSFDLDTALLFMLCTNLM
ncbi:hypothetical protein LDG_5450 [Legionella drancourtii LLAP12]|uniref:Uncharacterized protein n=1 Tax=Legionella drancourtii LLAP12 TaxID=658187 RepID=G9EJT4_9GAMM|nr:hypothetical protein LDG_5450 [Legionella drancourtii LLAP12]